MGLERKEDVMRLCILTAALLAVGFAAHGAELKVSKDSFGASWPLLVDSGTLSCTVDPGTSSPMVTFIHPTGTYALNGGANTRAKQKGWFPLNSIWRPNPDIPGTRVDIHALIAPGLKLCQR